MQRREITASKKHRVVRSLDSDISLAGLEAYATRRQEATGEETRWKQINKVLHKAKALRPGVARLRIDYVYSPLGRAFVEAGHCTGSREYALGVDPFKGWSKHLRGAAYHDMGWEFDDEAAYPRAKMAMVPQGKEVTEVFLTHREEIMQKLGAKLFANEPCAGNRRDWVKCIFASYDNDAQLDGWVKTTKGHPTLRSVEHVQLEVGSGERRQTFRPKDYWKAQQLSSAWMWDNAGEELREFMRERHPKMGSRGLKLLWKSYVLQEAEAVGREAKVMWALQRNIPVLSLQHDAVITGRWESEAANEEEGVEMACEMSMAASALAGYEVTVKAKWAENFGAQSRGWIDKGLRWPNAHTHPSPTPRDTLVLI